MRIATVLALAGLTVPGALVGQDTFRVEYRSGFADERGRPKGDLVVTDDTIFFRAKDTASSFAIPVRSVDSVFAVLGEERTTTAAILSGLAGGIAFGARSAFGYARRGRSPAEFLCIRVSVVDSTSGLSLDSTRVVIVKTKNYEAIVVGNAIWSRMMHHPSPAR
jgi:hypothetical protein